MSGKRAIIDIGSNTVRLVIYNGPPRAPVVLLNEKVTPRLGRDVARTGLLSDKAMQIALAALRRYAALIAMMEIADVQTVATAASRDARNGPEFLNKIEALGLRPRLLSGKEEACTSAMGVISAFPGARGVAGDLGGGSLELTRIAGDACHEAVTLPLGTLRLPEMREGGDEAFAGLVRQSLRDAGWKQRRAEPFYIVGGSWRALALYAMAQLDWPLDDPHDLELLPDDAARICTDLAAGRMETQVSRISSSRLESLPHAAALLLALVHTLRPSRIVFSSWGLREGLLHSSLDEATRRLDPVIEGIGAFVKRYDVDPDTAVRIADWIAEAMPEAQGEDRPVWLAATMLSLAAMRTEPNVRSEEAMDWALRKRWIGLNSRGRALVATAVLANNGDTQIPQALERFAEPQEFERAVRWGLAVRLARKLTNGNAAALARTGLRRRDGRLVLSLDETTACLVSPGIAKIFARLADRLGLKPDLEGAEEPDAT